MQFVRIKSVVLASLLIALGGAGRGPAGTGPAGTGPAGSDAERNATVAKKLAENLKIVEADQQGLEKVLGFLKDNMELPLRVDWQALKKQGITAETPVTLSVKERTVEDVLQYVTWLMRPTQGAVAIKIEKGEVVVYAVPGTPRIVESARQRERNVKTAADLKEKIKVIVAEEQDLEKVLGFIRDNLAIDFLIDWQELEKIGVTRQSKVTVNRRDIAGDALLTAILGSLKGTKAKAGWQVSGGIVRISADARLVRERPLPAAAAVPATVPATAPATRPGGRG